MVNWLSQTLDDNEIKLAKIRLCDMHPIKNIPIEKLFTWLSPFKYCFEKIRANRLHK
jgi:hypothetical protein